MPKHVEQLLIYMRGAKQFFKGTLLATVSTARYNVVRRVAKAAGQRRASSRSSSPRTCPTLKMSPPSADSPAWCW